MTYYSGPDGYCSVKENKVQPNLSIADMLYNGHLVIADIFLWNRRNYGQTLIEKPLYSGHVYSGHLLYRHFF